MHGGLSLDRDPAAAGWNRHYRLRAVHRLRVLRGRLPVPGALQGRRAALCLRRDAAVQRIGSRGSAPSRRRAEMHVLRRPRQLRHRLGHYSRSRSARDAGLRQFLHRRRAALRRSRRSRQQRLETAARAPAFSHARRARYRSRLLLSLRQSRRRGRPAASGPDQRPGIHPRQRRRALAAVELGLARGRQFHGWGRRRGAIPARGIGRPRRHSVRSARPRRSDTGCGRAALRLAGDWPAVALPTCSCIRSNPG